MLNGIISYAKPKSVVSEAYRALRTNLEFSLGNGNQKVILITSSHVGEGKSTIAANLAAVFAMQNKKTLLIDADMRRGLQHKKFNISILNGLSNYLADMHLDSNNFIKKTEIDNLYLISCGAVPPNPTELLSSDRMETLLSSLRDEFDVIIIDGAPVLPVTDSVIIARLVDKIILVASSRETHNDELKSAKDILDNVGVKIAGVVLNKVEANGKMYNKYGKYGNSYYENDNVKLKGNTKTGGKK